MKRTVFFISDGTGITAETLGHSLLAQFDGIDFRSITIPYVNNDTLALDAVSRINKAATADNAPPIVFDTIVNEDVRRILAKSNGFMIDIFSSFLKPLETALGASSSYSVGKSHSIVNNQSYDRRIVSVPSARDNDGGPPPRHYDLADVILV